MYTESFFSLIKEDFLHHSLYSQYNNTGSVGFMLLSVELHIYHLSVVYILQIPVRRKYILHIPVINLIAVVIQIPVMRKLKTYVSYVHYPMSF